MFARAINPRNGLLEWSGVQAVGCDLWGGHSLDFDRALLRAYQACSVDAVFGGVDEGELAQVSRLATSATLLRIFQLSLDNLET